jgi:YesN/AraC family two-component response regulator
MQADFPMHWHSDLELLYCLEGSFYVGKEEGKYYLEKGDMILVGSCEPHSLFSGSAPKVNAINLGFLFFGKDFNEIRNLRFSDPVLRGNEKAGELMARLAELNEREKSLTVKIEMRGSIYQLMAILLSELPLTEKVAKRQQERLFAVSRIQNALDFVAMHYGENITVEQAAEVSGYEKSAFCRSFKNATNATFHHYLNTYRIRKAEVLLTESNDSISAISFRVGFSQHKNFCRLFKEQNGVSPSEYRKKYR